MKTLKNLEDFIRKIEHLHPDRIIYIGSGIAEELKPQIIEFMKKYPEHSIESPTGLVFNYIGYTFYESKRVTPYETQVSFFSPPPSIKVPDTKISQGFVEGLKHEISSKHEPT